MPTETIISQVRKKESFKGLDKVGKFYYGIDSEIKMHKEFLN